MLLKNINFYMGIRSRVAHNEWDEALRLASQSMTTITPDKMMQRTTPAIRWVAEPNLKENPHKWGAEQGHPHLVA